MQVLLGVFASNSINILAGVNGLEAGQTFIIACAVLLHNLLMVRVNCVHCDDYWRAQPTLRSHK